MSAEVTTDAIKALFGRLVTAPRQLFEVCSGVSHERLATPLAPGKWSPLQIIRHLSGCDQEAFLPRIEKILAEEHPFLPAWDQDQWLHDYGAVGEDQAVVLIDGYARLREKVCVLLFDLEVEEWSRTGNHEERGSVTLFELCGYFADHDELHRQQIAAHVASDANLGAFI